MTGGSASQREQLLVSTGGASHGEFLLDQGNEGHSVGLLVNCQRALAAAGPSGSMFAIGKTSAFMKQGTSRNLMSCCWKHLFVMCWGSDDKAAACLRSR